MIMGENKMMNDVLETILKLKEKYSDYSYGVKSNGEYNPEHEDYMWFNDNIILTEEKYYKILEYMKLQGKIELFNEILSDNPDLCCISGCNQKKEEVKKE